MKPSREIQKLMYKFDELILQLKTDSYDYSTEESLEIIKDDALREGDFVAWIDDNTHSFCNKDELYDYLEFNFAEYVHLDIDEYIVLYRDLENIRDAMFNPDYFDDEQINNIFNYLCNEYIEDNYELLERNITKKSKMNFNYNIYETFEKLNGIINKVDIAKFNEDLAYLFSKDDDFLISILNSRLYHGKYRANMIYPIHDGIISKDDKDSKIIFADEMYRRVLLRINENLIMEGNTLTQNIDIILDYLYGILHIDKFFYKYYFGENFSSFDEENLTQILMLIVISDYIKFINLVKNNESLESINEYYLDVIKTKYNSVFEVCDLFETDDNFAKLAINGFLVFNEEYFHNMEKIDLNIDDKKFLKRIDPFYSLSKIKNRQSNF